MLFNHEKKGATKDTYCYIQATATRELNTQKNTAREWKQNGRSLTANLVFFAMATAVANANAACLLLVDDVFVQISNGL